MEEKLITAAVVVAAVAAALDGAAAVLRVCARRWPACQRWADRAARAKGWVSGIPGLPPAR